MGKLFFISLFFSACLLSFHACHDDDYTTNPRHILSFSRDTLMLDTIFTTIGTSTSILKVYNRNKDALLISSIQLADAGNSGFRINVDGIKGTQFADVEIKGKDSIYLFVEATVDATSGNLPFLVKDSIVFRTNGVQQDIKLRAYGWNADVLRGKAIKQDTTFTALRPILIYDSLHIAKNATLTLEAGTQLFFHQKAGLRVYGSLTALGSIARPVVMRGDRTDNLFSNMPYDRLPGQWEGVRFYASSYGNRLDYADIRGAGYGILCDSSQVDVQKLVLTNSRITQTSGNALSMTASKAVVANTEISNAGRYCVDLLGGDYEFIHCTLANYFSWDVRRGTALSISNTNSAADYPLRQASFRNCIVTGSSSDELTVNRSKDEAVPFGYRFSYCLINSASKEGGEFGHVVWTRDDNFLLIDRSLLLYDFRPAEASAAINAGYLPDAMGYPVDRNGVSRVSDEAPDAGCYEYAGQ